MPALSYSKLPEDPEVCQFFGFLKIARGTNHITRHHPHSYFQKTNLWCRYSSIPKKDRNVRKSIKKKRKRNKEKEKA